MTAGEMQTSQVELIENRSKRKTKDCTVVFNFYVYSFERLAYHR